MKLTEEHEPTIFLGKSRTMISKGSQPILSKILNKFFLIVMNQSRSADIRPPSSIVPEMKTYNVDFTRYHQVCQTVSQLFLY